MKFPIPVAVLGATGSVGQRFVSLLDGHPWFRLVALTGSDRTAGKSYKEGCTWVLNQSMPDQASEILLTVSDSEYLNGAAICFSALPTDEAKIIEPKMAKAGLVVCSNASAFRADPDVPLLLPEVNPEHIELVKSQRQNRGWSGAILTNPNCTSTGMTVSLKALNNAIGVKRVFAVSLQALSGAGYPGVPSMDIIDNVIPYIGGEENKVETEPNKMIGKFLDGKIIESDIKISAHTNRVAVVDGHTVVLSVELNSEIPEKDVIKIFTNYKAPEFAAHLPSAPSPVLVYRNEVNRPQPKLDRDTGKGMTTVIGRVRKDPIFSIKFVTLSHNTIRGAAGGSIYNAELFVDQGLL